MHREARQFVASAFGRIPQPGRVLEIGSRNVNGGVRHLFGCEYLGIDLVAGRGVDVVADGVTYEPDTAPDCVVCCEVLEHAPDPKAIVDNALRMLRRGGVLILTCAGPARAPHGCDGGAVGSEHYRGIDPDELRTWLRGLAWSEVTTDARGTDVYAICQIE